VVRAEEGPYGLRWAPSDLHGAADIHRRGAPALVLRGAMAHPAPPHRAHAYGADVTYVPVHIPVLTTYRPHTARSLCVSM